MARRCFFCEKSPVVDNRVSHSNIKTKTRSFPNLQKVRASVDGLTRRVYSCTRCLRSGFLVKPKVNRRPATVAAPVDQAATA